MYIDMMLQRIFPWLYKNPVTTVDATNETKASSTNQLNEKEFFSVKELAGKLGISRNLAYKLIKTASFPYLKIGNRFLIPKGMFNDWVQSQVETSKRTYNLYKEN
jgi:excisionase family DNA binding protein